MNAVNVKFRVWLPGTYPIMSGKDKFSDYLINPCRYRFRTVIRILGLVLLFIQNVSRRQNIKLCSDFFRDPNFTRAQEFLVHGNGEYVVSEINFGSYPTKDKNVAVVHLSNALLNAAITYFFRKATIEIKKFVEPSKYENNSIMKDEILYYTGRILPTQKISGKLSLGDAALDLSASSFIVPMTDEHSPIAYAIVSETHWYNPDVSHGGIESVLRYSQQTAFVIGGRNLVKKIKK